MPQRKRTLTPKNGAGKSSPPQKKSKTDPDKSSSPPAKTPPQGKKPSASTSKSAPTKSVPQEKKTKATTSAKSSSQEKKPKTSTQPAKSNLKTKSEKTPAPKKNVKFQEDESDDSVQTKKNITKKSVPPRPQKNAKSAPSAKTAKPQKNKPVEKKQRAPRKRATLETHIEKYDALLKVLDEEIERKQKEREKGTRVLRSVRKTVRELRTEAPKIAHAKRRFASNGKKVSGLELRYNISDELAAFMKIPRGSTPSRNDITNAICVYIHAHPGETRPQMTKWNHLNPKGKRNLQNPSSKMTIIPDDALDRLLNYKQYKNDVKKGKITQVTTDKKTGKKETTKVTDPALKYCVVQKLICRHILGAVSVKKDEEVEDNEEEEVEDAEETDEE